MPGRGCELPELGVMGTSPDGQLGKPLVRGTVTRFCLDAQGDGLVNDGVNAGLIEAFRRRIRERVKIPEAFFCCSTGSQYDGEVNHLGPQLLTRLHVGSQRCGLDFCRRAGSQTCKRPKNIHFVQKN